MKTSSKRRVLVATVLYTLAAGVSSRALGEGIPEPGLTMYGVVKNDIGGVHVRMTSGTLHWTVVPPSGPPVIVTTDMRNINEQFSYVVDIPFETAVPGSPPTTNALQLRATTTSYDRSDVTVGTNAATIVSAGSTFIFSQPDRASVERVDLDTAISYPDQDGDGLPDYWEDDHFSGFADPGDDPDDDGLTNLKEYLSGCNPNDPGSAFLFVETEPAPGGGFVVSWGSQEGRYYTVARSQDLLAGFAPLQTGLPATPAVNTFTDPTATGDGPWFYRIIIE